MIFTALAQEDFEGVETALADAFRRAQEAARNEEPIVFVLSQEDLLGQRGVPGAILANALLCGMRTLAAEGHRANAVAVGPDADAGGPAALDRAARGRPRRRRRTRPRARGARGQDPGMRSRSSPARRAASARRSPTGSQRDHDVLRVDIDPSVDGVVADVTNPDDRARISTPSTARSPCWSTTPASPATRGS